MSQLENLERVLKDILQLPVEQKIVACIIFGLSFILLLSTVTKVFQKRRPPVVKTWPFIGGVLKFIYDKPLKIMQDNYKRYGEVFTLPIFHKKMTFLLGPDASIHFFKASDDEVDMKEVYGYSVPTFGPDVVYDVDTKTRAEQFRFFTDALKAQRIRSYVGMMVQEATDYFGKWPEEGVVDLFEEFSKLIIMTASRTLMGREVRESMFHEVAKYFHDLDAGMQPLSVIAPYFPTEYHRKRDRAREQLVKVFSKIVDARRASGAREDDVIQSFIDARYKDGRALKGHEITGLLIAVLFAGQHTSSVTSSWTGYEVINGKAKWLPAILKEQKEVMAKHGDKLDFDVLQEMDVLHRSIKEALRMHPPLIMLMRYVLEPFDVQTSTGEAYHIPKGHIIATSPTFHHRLEHVFGKPDTYDPERYAAPREEDKKKPASFIGFGYGRHQCMGETFAYMQIKTIWSLLFRQFDFDMVDPLPKENWDSMVVGPLPCKVRFRRRKIE